MNVDFQLDGRAYLAGLLAAWKNLLPCATGNPLIDPATLPPDAPFFSFRTWLRPICRPAGVTTDRFIVESLSLDSLALTPITAPAGTPPPVVRLPETASPDINIRASDSLGSGQSFRQVRLVYLLVVRLVAMRNLADGRRPDPASVVTCYLSFSAPLTTSLASTTSGSVAVGCPLDTPSLGVRIGPAASLMFTIDAIALPASFTSPLLAIAPLLPALSIATPDIMRDLRLPGDVIFNGVVDPLRGVNHGLTFGNDVLTVRLQVEDQAFLERYSTTTRGDQVALDRQDLKDDTVRMWVDFFDPDVRAPARYSRSAGNASFTVMIGKELLLNALLKAVKDRLRDRGYSADSARVGWQTGSHTLAVTGLPYGLTVEADIGPSGIETAPILMSIYQAHDNAAAGAFNGGFVPTLQAGGFVLSSDGIYLTRSQAITRISIDRFERTGWTEAYAHHDGIVLSATIRYQYALARSPAALSVRSRDPAFSWSVQQGTEGLCTVVAVLNFTLSNVGDWRLVICEMAINSPLEIASSRYIYVRGPLSVDRAVVPLSIDPGAQLQCKAIIPHSTLVPVWRPWEPPNEQLLSMPLLKILVRSSAGSFLLNVNNPFMGMRGFDTVAACRALNFQVPELERRIPRPRYPSLINPRVLIDLLRGNDPLALPDLASGTGGATLDPAALAVLRGAAAEPADLDLGAILGPGIDGAGSGVTTPGHAWSKDPRPSDTPFGPTGATDLGTLLMVRAQGGGRDD